MHCSLFSAYFKNGKSSLFLKTGLKILFLVFLVGCAATPPYSAYDSATRQITDNAVRYGTIAAAGAGGYFLGQKYLGGVAGGALGAIGGIAVSYGLTKFYDQKRLEAYIYGIKIGEKAGRSEISNEIERRKEVYGLPAPWEGDGSDSPTIRDVYVPQREVNGVEYGGDYQRVPVYK